MRRESWYLARISSTIVNHFLLEKGILGENRENFLLKSGAFARNFENNGFNSQVFLNFPALQTLFVEMNKLLQKYFGFDPATTTIRTEIIAGVSTFLTMAYILAVNPAILGITGMDKGALFATTAITSGIATLIMALYAKMPFGLAPGMGINAFFAYTAQTPVK